MQNGTQTADKQLHDAPAAQSFPSAAHTALAHLPIVRAILEYLKDSYVRPEQSSLADLNASNGALRACALVSPLWSVAAREVLFAKIAFTRRESVRMWLDVVGDGQSKYKTRELHLYDQYPFKPAQDEDDARAKWSYAELDKLFSKLTGLEDLEMMFLWQRHVPGDWLTHENLATLTKLALCSPISKPSKPLAMLRLEKVHLVDICGDKLERDWGATCAALGSSPGARHVTELDLHAFPEPEPYLVRLLPLTTSLRRLSLHALRPSPHLWQVYLFLAGCTTLDELQLGIALGGALEALLCCPAGPPTLIVETLVGAVGHGHPHVRQRALEPCPVAVLLDVLRRKERGSVRSVMLQHVRATTYDYAGEMFQLRMLTGIDLMFALHKGMNDDEERRLSYLIGRSQRDAQHKALHPTVEFEAVE
ncbi:hypothetical protein JCM10450v2_005129 [Rhodotorula kratochvilovae]